MVSVSLQSGASSAGNGSVLEIAQDLTALGFFVVPLPFWQKRPVLRGWQNLRLTPDQLPQHFSGAGNVGALMGTAVHGKAENGFVSDLDHDCGEAIQASSELLRETTWAFGRASRRRSHGLYLTDSPVASIQFRDPVREAAARRTAKKGGNGKAKKADKPADREHHGPSGDADGDRDVGDDAAPTAETGHVPDHESMLLELRCLKKDLTVGLQTIMPGSIHPTGERIEWEPNRGLAPARLKAEDLVWAAERTASAALLARYWPPEGSRNEAFLALAGMLARNGWTQNEAAALVRAIYRVLWPENPDFRAAEAEVAATFAKFAAGKDISGRRRLKELGVDERVLKRCAEWLHLPRNGSPSIHAGDPSPTYFEKNGRLYRHGPVRDGILVDIQLTSFTARIEENVVLDDGCEERISFRIRAEVGDIVRVFDLTATQFEKPEWSMERIGSDAFSLPREWEHAKAAIRSLSVGAPRRTVFTYLGWRKVGDTYIYLHGPGAIGPTGMIEGIETRLPPALARYQLRLPRDTAEMRQAIVASLRTCNLAPPRITYPLLSLAYRANLGTTPFSVSLEGPSGVYKTTLASCFQQHYGPDMGWGIDGFHLPLGFESTANAAEAISFLAKDTLLTIDDFTPSVDPHESARIQGVAARLIRSAANNSARQRLSRDGGLQPGHPPRGALLFTAEHAPKEQSLMARLLVIEVHRGEVQLEALTVSQRDGDLGLLCIAMGAFVQWSAARFEQRATRFAARARELRSKIVRPHARTPGAVAELWAAFELFLEFAVEMGAIDEAQRRGHADKAENAFRELAGFQGAGQLESDPALRFQSLVRAAVAAGRAHIRGMPGDQYPPGSLERERLGWRKRGDSEWVPGGDTIGWIGNEGLFLNFEAAEAMAQRLATEARAPLPVGGLTLKRRLEEAGLLASRDTNRQRMTVRLPGDPERTPALHVVKDFLSGPEDPRPEGAPENPSSLDPGEEIDL
jgi:hypothetical protein